jgi:hypothetical protein
VNTLHIPHGQTRLEARGLLVDDAAHRTREEFGDAAGLIQLVRTVDLVMAHEQDGLADPVDLRQEVADAKAGWSAHRFNFSN